jgi:hypothetical protein
VTRIRTATYHCPRCQKKHIAGVEGDGSPWFTCGRVKIHVPPDEQATLGTPQAVATAKLSRPLRAGCLGCGRMVDTSGDGDDGLRRFICYRCNHVGAYEREIRTDWAPERETWLFAEAADEIVEARMAGQDEADDLPNEGTIGAGDLPSMADKIREALDAARGADLPLVIEPDDPIHDEDARVASGRKRGRYERFVRWMSGQG